MKFINEEMYYIDTDFFEVCEQVQAEKYITSDCVVLELGARYGTISCIINNKLAVRTNQVSVEPDPRVHRALEVNKTINKCGFHILKGFISNVPMDLTDLGAHFGYGTRSYKVSQSLIPSYTLEHIQAKFGLRFNTLVADCEGFLEQFFDENPDFYKQLNLILFEKDCPERSNYDKISQNLLINGFKQLESGFNEVWKR
jgi:FkbM family methyltransferase